MENRILEGLTILLVEEEALIAMDIEQLCYEHGATTVLTISSEENLSPEALATGASMAELSNVDAAVLDARIGDGWTTELARRLTELGVPFIFATGYTSAEPVFEEFPEVTVVPKPYKGLELIEAITATIRRPRSDDRS